MSKIPGVTLFALGGITLFSLFKLEVSIPKEIWQGRQPTQLEMELAVRKQTEIEREAAHRRKLEEMNAQRRLTPLTITPREVGRACDKNGCYTDYAEGYDLGSFRPD